MNKKSFQPKTRVAEWRAVHRRYLPFIFGLGLLHLATVFIHQLISADHAFWKLQLVEFVVLSDLILLPLAAVNSVFLCQQLFRKRVKKGWKMIVLKTLAAAAGVALVSSVLEQVYMYVGFFDDDYIIFGGHQFSASISNVINNAGVAIIIGLPIFIWQMRVDDLSFQLKEKELEQERLEKLKTQAELHALQSRINPHFLFNSFNSIASLISSNPDKAEKMVVQLSTLFRYSLNSESSNFVTIATELLVVETYLGIEKVRFGEHLEYEVDVPADLLDREIPRFLIQPLIENAVKHGISKVKRGAVRLEISETDIGMQIAVYDNGAAFPDPLPRGYGLQSTYDKLHLLYPDRHQMVLENTPEKRVQITLMDR